MPSKEFSDGNAQRQIEKVGEWVDSQGKRTLFSYVIRGVVPTLQRAYLVNDEPLVILDSSAEWNDKIVVKFELHCSEKHAEAMEAAGVLSFTEQTAENSRD